MPKLSDSSSWAPAPIGRLRAGINDSTEDFEWASVELLAEVPAPTLEVSKSPLGAGFTPARVDYHTFPIAQPSYTYSSS